jgi:2-keto-3-deoxy-L-rhamnonate aldolase RhmA
MFRPNQVKRRMGADQPVFGVVHTLSHPATAELLGMAGCDFVLIDAEHGQGDHQAHLGCLQAVSATPAHSIVRLASDDRNAIKRILDLGAEGVMIPNVSTADQARAVVAACRYPPHGVRGFAASGVRASSYGVQAGAYLADVEAELLIVVMIETAEGVRNAAAIAAVDGVDVVQVGANDLSYDLGVPGELAHPALQTAIGEIETAVLQAGKLLGGAPTSRSAADLIARGYRMITVGRDASFLAGAVSGALAESRTTAQERAARA